MEERVSQVSPQGSSERGGRPVMAAIVGVDQAELQARVDGILNRHPAVGLAVGVVRNGSLEFFLGHGLADIASSSPVTGDTVFRIGSITKTFTAIAVMQLWEQGLVDLDAPANDYLRAYKLVPAEPSFRPAILRHLLTHTAGIPEVVYAADLLHPSWGPFEGRPVVRSVKVGEPLPSLAEYYRGGLRLVAEPGSAFAYSNHGFATLGQIVEDVSGVPLERYLRERIFEPLGMADSDLVRSERVTSRLATGYVLGPRGASPVPDRDWVGAGGGGIYSTTRDLARYLVALFRGDAGEHRVVGHDGILPGFNSELSLAPDDGVGVVALTNGARGAFVWLQAELGRLLRHLLGVPDEVVRSDVPHHPEVWGDICGHYRLPPRISDLRGRVATAGGAEVFVRGGRPMLRVLTPVPALYRGFPLHPDDEEDPYAFRLDLSAFGMGTARVVFSHEAGAGTTACHTELQAMSLYKRPGRGRPAARLTVALGALAAAGVVAGRRRGRRHERRAVALPVGIGDGLSQAVQVIGPRYREDLCLDAAAALEDRVGVITPIDPRWW